MSVLLTTRAPADAEKDIAALAARGITALKAPMLEIRAMTDIALRPDMGFDAIAFTSHHAPAFIMEKSLRACPCFCVGMATAEAAREHGFRNIIIGGGDGEALAGKIKTAHAKKPFKRMLWAAGKHAAFDLAAALDAAGIPAQKIIFYEAVQVSSFPDDALRALESGAVRAASIHAARAGENFTRLMHARNLPQENITLIAISKRVAGFCGAGWHAIRIAETPTGAAMLDAAAGVMRESNGVQ